MVSIHFFVGTILLLHFNSIVAANEFAGVKISDLLWNWKGVEDVFGWVSVNIRNFYVNYPMIETGANLFSRNGTLMIRDLQKSYRLSMTQLNYLSRKINDYLLPNEIIQRSDDGASVVSKELVNRFRQIHQIYADAIELRRNHSEGHIHFREFLNDSLNFVFNHTKFLVNYDPIILTTSTTATYEFTPEFINPFRKHYEVWFHSITTYVYIS